jgi:cytoskeletal protein RodZ
MTEEQNINLTIGRLLREKRESKNISLKVISQQTKIHVGLLEYLEKDELHKLPSKIYVRGFVKATAKELGIDVKYALSLLEEAYKDTTPEVKVVAQEEYLPKESLDYFKALKNTALTSSSLVAKIFIAFIFVAILGINIKSYLEQPNDDLKQKLPVVLTTVHQKSKPAVKKVPTKTAEEIAEAAKVASAAMPVNLIHDKKDKTTTVIIPPINKDPTAKPQAIKEVLKDVTKDNKIELPKEEQKKIISEYLPAKFQIIPPAGLQYVFLNAADGDSWVTYKVDNNSIKKFVLRQGRTLFIHGAMVRLFLGNTKTIKMFYNRNLISFKDKSGPANLVFPESAKDQYPDPLFIFEKDGNVKTNTP